MKHYPLTNQGFMLVPLLLFLVISLLMILAGSKELHQAVLMHHLKMHKDCLYLHTQLNSVEAGNLCPPCPKAAGCL